MLNPNTIQQSLVDAITERPISFSVGSVCYNIYPPSLGVHLLRSRLLSSLELDSKLLELNPTLELMRLVHEYRDIVLHLIALSTLRGYAEVNDSAKLNGRPSASHKTKGRPSTAITSRRSKPLRAERSAVSPSAPGYGST